MPRTKSNLMLNRFLDLNYLSVPSARLVKFKGCLATLIRISANNYLTYPLIKSNNLNSMQKYADWFKPIRTTPNLISKH